MLPGRASCAATTARWSACWPRTRCASSSPTSPSWARARVDARARRVGHHDGRGADQAADDRRRRQRRADRRRREVLDDRRRARVRAGVDRPHRHRRAAAGRRAARPSTPPGSRSRSHEADDRRRRRLPRPARLRRAAGARRSGSGSRRSSCTTSTPTRLERIGAVLDGLAAEHGARLPFRTTTDLVDAVEGADFVFCAIRVGQLEGRVVDEDVPLGLGVLGQETTGPGGICFALRTIPVMVRLAETIAKHAPDAWLINFTNPAGMVTEAVQQVLGDRAVGICDSPSGLCRRVAAAVGRDPARAVVRLLRAQPPRLAAAACATTAASALLDGLLEDDARLDGFEEGRLFGGEWLRSLGMIPNEYLYYFYYAADTVNAIRGEPALARRVPARAAARVLRPRRAAAGGRARRLARHPPRPRAHVHGRGAQRGGRRVTSTRTTPTAATRARRWRCWRRSRSTRRAVLILNTANRSALPFLDERAVVEVPCVVGRAGPVPMAMGEVPAHARGAGRDDEGRRAHDDRRRAAGLARAGGQGARAAPARPVGHHRARDLRRLPRAPARAAGGVPA